MPGKPRFYLPVIPAYLIQSDYSRQAVFFGDEDYAA